MTDFFGRAFYTGKSLFHTQLHSSPKYSRVMKMSEESQPQFAKTADSASDRVRLVQPRVAGGAVCCGQNRHQSHSHPKKNGLREFLRGHSFKFKIPKF